jgi:hypothetical protein
MGQQETRTDGLKGMDGALGEWNLTAANHASSEASSGLGAFFLLVAVVVAVAGLWLVVSWSGGAHLFFSAFLSRAWLGSTLGSFLFVRLSL